MSMALTRFGCWPHEALVDPAGRSRISAWQLAECMAWDRVEYEDEKERNAKMRADLA